MLGPPTFVIDDFRLNPGVPDVWSFSSLGDFAECPRRWALKRTPVRLFNGNIPEQPTRRSLEGILLHSLVERFSSSDGLQPFRPRRELLAVLDEWQAKNSSNPRVRAERLAGAVGVEEILRAFADIAPQLPQRWAAFRVTKKPARRAPANCTEVGLRDPNSKLVGRADAVRGAEIVEIKTGQQRDRDTEQVLFYAALYLAIYGKPPDRLTVVYTALNERVDVQVPTRNDLQALLNSLRTRYTEVEQAVIAGTFDPLPEPAKCSMCHVRPFCGAYWRTFETSVPNSAGESLFGDYKSGEDALLSRVGAGAGAYLRDRIHGLPSSLYFAENTAINIREGSARLRITNLNITRDAQCISLYFTEGSEVYEVDQTVSDAILRHSPRPRA